MCDYCDAPNLWMSYGDLSFIRVCPKCGKFVKADEEMCIDEYLGADEGSNGRDNATCKRCGRVRMPCNGWVGKV